MSKKWTAPWTILAGAFLMLSTQTIPVRGQEPTPVTDETCVSCHTHQYYLYDSGKWFCLCDAPMHCVYCHGGRTDSSVKETAHEGLVLYPTRDQAERCQTCHQEDYLSRVVAFETVAGVSATPQPLITATAGGPAASVAEQPPSPPMLRLSQLEPWRLAGLAIIGLALIGVLAFGYNCWKSDCLRRRSSQSP